LTLQGRVLLVRRITEEGWRIVDAANAAGISVRQSYRWLARYRRGAAAGALADRSSAPHQCKHGIGADRVGEIERLRQQRMSGPAIARELSMPISTVGIILRRIIEPHSRKTGKIVDLAFYRINVRLIERDIARMLLMVPLSS